MQLSAAPILHARTKDVDFRANLLVVPEWFTPSDVAWCRTFITESTRYFEMVGSKGRKVMFCSDSTLIIGLSIPIKNLYALCNRQPKYHLVDGNRTNYAFIGFAFPRTECIRPFCVPEAMLLKQFENYMDLRWSDSISEKQSLLATRVPAAVLDFPEAAPSEMLPVPATGQKQVFSSEYVASDRLIAEILSKLHPGWNPAFCSDLPNATSFLSSHFQIATSAHWAAIREALAAVPSQNAAAYALPEETPQSPPAKASLSGFFAKAAEKIRLPVQTAFAERILEKKQEAPRPEDPPRPPIWPFKK